MNTTQGKRRGMKPGRERRPFRKGVKSTATRSLSLRLATIEDLESLRRRNGWSLSRIVDAAVVGFLAMYDRDGHAIGAALEAADDAA
jgi:hypothetical protein